MHNNLLGIQLVAADVTSEHLLAAECELTDCTEREKTEGLVCMDNEGRCVFEGGSNVGDDVRFRHVWVDGTDVGRLGRTIALIQTISGPTSMNNICHCFARGHQEAHGGNVLGVHKRCDSWRERQMSDLERANAVLDILEELIFACEA